MTSRTEANQPTPIERATRDVAQSIAHNAHHFYREHRVDLQHGTTEPEFKRILALYFHDRSLADWSQDLGIPDATDPHDTARS